jgi:alginate O-acetyltransferase complex protein AlgJ
MISALAPARLASTAEQTRPARPQSGLMHRRRRLFAAATFGLLATPLIVGLVKPDSPAAILKEGRRLAPLPPLPDTVEGWRDLPKEIDAYLKDHFGFRQVMIRADKDLNRAVSFAGEDVLVGRDGQLFLLANEAVRQSAGLVVRDARVAETVSVLTRIHAALAARGVRFLVAVPPNAATIYQDLVPHWAQNRGVPTEYDVLLEGLKANGVPAVDLRPAVAAARAGGPVFYKHDTHWTSRGALAGFNALVEADSHPDWRIDPKTALAPPVTMTVREAQDRMGVGDLTRLLGSGESERETIESSTLPSAKSRLLTSNPYGGFVAETGRPGPTIMVIGDSFTRNSFLGPLAEHAGQVVWLEHRRCGFDWGAIDRFRPDEVWWAPTERFLLCDPGVAPENFPG